MNCIKNIKNIKNNELRSVFLNQKTSKQIIEMMNLIFNKTNQIEKIEQKKYINRLKMPSRFGSPSKRTRYGSRSPFDSDVREVEEFNFRNRSGAGVRGGEEETFPYAEAGFDGHRRSSRSSAGRSSAGRSSGGRRGSSSRGFDGFDGVSRSRREPGEPGRSQARRKIEQEIREEPVDRSVLVKMFQKDPYLNPLTNREITPGGRTYRNVAITLGVDPLGLLPKRSTEIMQGTFGTGRKSGGRSSGRRSPGRQSAGQRSAGRRSTGRRSAGRRSQ
jgi:hypothetical protein